MILLDTNVLIYAFDLDSPFYQWARETIADAVAGDGADHRDKQLVEAEIAGVKRLGYRSLHRSYRAIAFLMKPILIMRISPPTPEPAILPISLMMLQVL
jgi:predicted nucleic acid-binding protein